MIDFPEERETSDEVRSIIALSLIAGIGASKIRTLVDHFGRAAAVWGATIPALSNIKGIGERTAKAIHSFSDFAEVDAQVQWAQQSRARLITYWSSDYPECLRSIFDPPAFLWARGQAQFQNNRTIAIVGTRKPSAYGLKVASELAQQLANNDFIIVSGLAYGIDAAAHQAALKAGGQTIAVLGSGVDRVYPAKHTRLANEIIHQGALLSEFPLGQKPDAVNFPKRNRIISGLALGTLVVEAYGKGGALITARLALEQNREVFAVPGSIYNTSSEGTNRLIQQGHAKLIYTVEDILVELGVAKADGQVHHPSNPIHLLATLNEIEQRLYEILTPEPMQIDHICDLANLDPSSALVYLLNLEFKGLVYQLSGKQFYRA